MATVAVLQLRGPLLEGEKLSCQQQQELDSLLLEFASLFEVPMGLPPSRKCDHQIPLLLEKSNPYRYPHYHKSEIEKQVPEMLSQGII